MALFDERLQAAARKIGQVAREEFIEPEAHIIGRYGYGMEGVGHSGHKQVQTVMAREKPNFCKNASLFYGVVKVFVFMLIASG